MYKIIGADGKEYGPVSADQMRLWLNEGRVNKQTRVLPEGNTDWKLLGEVPELAGVLPPVAPPGFVPVNADQSTVLQMVRGPAIFILVLAILNVLSVILSFVWLAFEDQIMAALGITEQTGEFQSWFKIFFSIPATVLGGCLAVACFVGALRMMKLKSHGFAVATAIMMLLPCGNCCCFLNIGAGIWALVVLSKPEVKSAFQ